MSGAALREEFAKCAALAGIAEGHPVPLSMLTSHLTNTCQVPNPQEVLRSNPTSVTVRGLSVYPADNKCLPSYEPLRRLLATVPLEGINVDEFRELVSGHAELAAHSVESLSTLHSNAFALDNTFVVPSYDEPSDSMRLAARRVVEASGPEGIDIQTITKAVSKQSGKHVTTSEVTLLLQGADDILLSRDHTARWVNWDRVMQTVAAALPVEGCLQVTMIKHIVAALPCFNVDCLQGVPFHEWVTLNFRSLFDVTVASDGSTRVFRHRQSMSPKQFEADVGRVLGAQTSMSTHRFVDLADIVPHLRGGPDAYGVSKWLDAVRECDGLEHEIRIVVRQKATARATAIFVDCDKLSADEAEKVLASCGDSAGTLQQTGAVTRRAVRRADQPAMYGDDVVVSSWMDTFIALGAQITALHHKLKATDGQVQLVAIVCHDEDIEAYIEHVVPFIPMSCDVALWSPSGGRIVKSMQ